VTAVGLTSNVPFNGMVSPGRTPRRVHAAANDAQRRRRVVGGDYSVRWDSLIQGRLFTDADGADSPLVVVIDNFSSSALQIAARSASRSAAAADEPRYTIVGVRRHDQQHRSRRAVTKERIYYPWRSSERRMALTVKRRPTSSRSYRRCAPRRVDRRGAANCGRADDGGVDGASLEGRRSPMLLLALFGAVA